MVIAGDDVVRSATLGQREKEVVIWVVLNDLLDAINLDLYREELQFLEKLVNSLLGHSVALLHRWAAQNVADLVHLLPPGQNYYLHVAPCPYYGPEGPSPINEG